MTGDLWVVLIGSLVAVSCSILGVFLVLRKIALIGDAISHAVLPGIVFSFMLTGSRTSLMIFVGAAVFGVIAVGLIQFLIQQGVQTDASIGFVFTTLFALGVVMISLHVREVDLDLDCVLYGEIAYAHWNTWEWFGFDLGPVSVWLLGTALAINILCITLFFKQFKICTFDPALALSLGIPVTFFHYLLMFLVSFTTVTSFESVGAILVVGMLIIPAATAYLWCDTLYNMLGLSAGIGIFSAVLGYIMAVILDASIAGAMVTSAGIFFIISFIFSPKYGLIRRLL